MVEQLFSSRTNIFTFIGGVGGKEERGRKLWPSEESQVLVHAYMYVDSPLYLYCVSSFRTKRMVVDVLKVQPGENLTEVLYTPATPEQVCTSAEWFSTVSVCTVCLYVHRKRNTSGLFRRGNSLSRNRCLAARPSRSQTPCLETGSKFV